MDHAVFHAAVVLGFLTAVLLGLALLWITQDRPAPVHGAPIGEDQWSFQTRDEPFERIVRTETRSLRSLLLRRGVRKPDVDDVLQEVWMALGKRDDLSGDLHTWLIGTAINCARNHYRTCRRLKRRLLVFGLDYSEYPGDAAPTGEQRLICNDIERAIDNLKPERRDVLKAYLAGDSMKEIAKHLGIPENTCYAVLRLARLDLKKALQRSASYQPLPERC